MLAEAASVGLKTYIQGWLAVLTDATSCMLHKNKVNLANVHTRSVQLPGWISLARICHTDGDMIIAFGERSNACLSHQ